jgi:hypothetical protein
MEFKKYQHVERFGTAEVNQIELGECYIFPKIDGTNASLWLDSNGNLCAGSRNRKLELDNDNAGFYNWAIQQVNIKQFFKENPNVRLFGEWLVPHSLKTYREDAWRQFYVFDMCFDKEKLHDGDSELVYFHYEAYKPTLEKYNINYIQPLCSIKNSNYDQLVAQLKKNVFLIEDGKGVGEGIVIKNYDFKNKYGRTTWAKIVTSEFKEKHSKVMGHAEIEGKKMIEETICEKYVTKALCEKVFAKINQDGWESKKIPQLLNMVYYDLIREDSWNFIKEHKNPTINFSTLKHFCFAKTKENIPQVFVA